MIKVTVYKGVLSALVVLGLLLLGLPTLAEDHGVVPHAFEMAIPGGFSLDMVVHEPVRLSLICEADPPRAPSDDPGIEGHPVLGSASRLLRVTLASWVGDPDGVAVGDELILNLFADALYTGTVDRVSIDTQGTLSVRGRVQACPASYILISTYEGRTLASVKIPGEGRQYLILYEPGTGNHYLAELDPARVDEVQVSPPLVPPPPGPEEEAEIAELQDRIAANLGPDDAATIDVMVVYTPLARDWADTYGGGINNVITQAMERAELVMDNSETLASMRLVHSAEVDYDEMQADSGTHLDRLTDPNDGYMDEVHDWRDQYGADLVALFARVEDTGGLAWVLTYQEGRPGWAFSLTRVQQAGWMYTHIHEMGHNMGCHHHKQQAVQPGPTNWWDWPENTWSAGWRWTGQDAGKYCSVMTYGWGDTTVAYFSNPGVDYQGEPTGHPVDGDNARTIREIKHVIAAYRAETVWPQIAVDPTGFEMTLPADTVHDYTLTIDNLGGADLTYEIRHSETTWQSREAQDERLFLTERAFRILEAPQTGSPVEPEPTGQTQGGWQTIMSDSFEGPWPGVWTAGAAPGATDAYWGKDGYRSYTGSYSAFCAKSGTAGVTPPADYRNDMEAWMMYGPFSLADASAAELNYRLWLDTEYGNDFLWLAASIDGQSFAGSGWTGDSGDWMHDSFDLADIPTLGNLCGQPQVWIAFVFESDFMVTAKGAFIDDVVLRKYVDDVNSPPHTPSNPSPANHATRVSIDADLGWTGGDPDADDTVTYDVYFGTSETPLFRETLGPLPATETGITYGALETLDYGTTYHWKIVATDNHEASASGPVWEFTTGWPACSWLNVSPDSGSIAPGRSDELTVTIDTSGLDPGEYSAEIVVANNDPENDTVIVPATLRVSDVVPTLTTQDASNIDTNSATLNMIYTLGGYSSVNVRFAYKKAADTDWTETAGVIKEEDGSHVETLIALDSGTHYDFKARLEYETIVIDGAELTFTTDDLCQVVTSELPAGELGVAYSATLEAAGGIPPYTWDWTAQEEGQAFPPGLDLSPETGVISGTPTEAGTFDFTVEVTDANETTATRELSIAVYEVVTFSDPNLEAAIREAIDKPTGEIYSSDLEGLTELDASWRSIADLTGLEHCTDLEYLRLGDNLISDISPVAHLTHLAELWLHANEISNISPLADLPNLTKLLLGGNQIDDVSSLADLTSLRKLDLGWNQINNISPLADLIDLTELDLPGNQIADISPLASLTALTVLNLYGNQIISDISPLADVTSLTHFNIGWNQVSDISSLAYLTGLTRLEFWWNPVSDIGPLADLTSLTELGFGWNQVSDLSPLTNLTSLTMLSAQGNLIADLSALADLGDLTRLYLGHNQISDISTLAKLTSLVYLGLQENQIGNIEPLLDNTGFSEGDTVDLRRNPLTITGVNDHIPALEARGVNVLWEPIDLSVVATRPPDAYTGVAYEWTIEAIGGVTPYTWEIVGGTLPEDLDLDADGGLISGTPVEAGVFDFTVGVTDAIEFAATAKFRLIILLQPDVTTNPASHISGTSAMLHGYVGDVGKPSTIITFTGDVESPTSREQSRYSYDDITVLQWVDPEHGEPLTYEQYVEGLPPARPLAVEQIYASPMPAEAQGAPQPPLFLVIVNSHIQPHIETSLDQYVLNLEIEGYSVTVHAVDGGTPSELRQLLQGELINGLIGAVLIGDLPVPWFEMHDDFNGYSQFPIDLYYMDLDGTWVDSDDSGMYDQHLDGDGDRLPEIWVGRLTASPLAASIEEEAALLENYLAKNHAYRTGDLILSDRALVYVDNDWEYWGQEFGDAIGLAYDTRTLVRDPAGTTAADYMDRLTHNYEWIQVHAHSSHLSHSFRTGAQWTRVYHSDIREINPLAFFYNLFACSNARYVEDNYMGGWYVFADTYGLAAVGSTKIGSMLDFEYFYGPIGQYRSLGESFKEWFVAVGPYEQVHRQWFYGMTLLGDPTLSRRPRVHVSFEYWSDPADTNETTGRPITAPGPFSDELTGLKPDTTYSFRARATFDGIDVYGDALSFTTAGPGIVTIELPHGLVQVAYAATLEAAGGTGPYTWAWTAEEEGQELPPGLDLTVDTGLISGTPTELGTFEFTVEVTDAEEDTGTRELSISIVEGVPYQAVTALNPGRDADGCAGSVASIVEVQDGEGDPVLVDVGSYEVTLSYDGTSLSVLEVRHDPLFPGGEAIDNAAGVTGFDGTATGGVPYPCDLAFLSLRLTGTAHQPVTATLTFWDIRDGGGNPIGQILPAAETTFLRGDANADGTVDIGDVLYIAQYLAGLREVGMGAGEVHPVNAASVVHDGDCDRIDISDALFIAQYLAGLRGPDYEWADN